MSDIRVVASGLRFPEGPVAMRDGSVVLVEIERQTVSRVAPDGTVTVLAHTGGGPNGQAGVVIVMMTLTFDLPSASSTPIP